MLWIMLSPIIVSVIVLIYALVKGFNKTALVIAASVAMVAEMFIMKYYSNSWYAFLFALTVPLAVTYVLLCLFLSIREHKEDGR
ncbi:MAG: hypothetical protein HFE73_07225 [Firmicutes bacterium]|jgi:hypothetical protein|nr:hypothetical protein [Bacillota bacterium]